MVAELLVNLLLHLFLGIFKNFLLSSETYGRTCVLYFAENFKVTFLSYVPMRYRVSLLEQVSLKRLRYLFALRYKFIECLPFSLKQNRNTSENLPFGCILLHLILFPHASQATPFQPKEMAVRTAKHADPVISASTAAEKGLLAKEGARPQLCDNQV